ncbi:hypothetical protein PILCRDRAFT_540053 [Piloderma croceum F 1598]|uniref:Uncharacterized protein n=1 Tax=Piloderma croceum (strain F 1598) TaxID=765440 RepID=A0A0C3BSG2_PILCF|nr:hypothetical protein PILCRDRAFT_540053 [Piloderma croceum F 1598]
MREDAIFIRFTVCQHICVENSVSICWMFRHNAHDILPQVPRNVKLALVIHLRDTGGRQLPLTRDYYRALKSASVDHPSPCAEIPTTFK